MKFLNYKLTLVAVLAIFLASCAGDGKDKTKEPVAQAFTPVGTVWESQPKMENGYLKVHRQQKIEFKTADTLIFSFVKTPQCGVTGNVVGNYGFVAEFKYTYDASKKEVKLADKFKFLFTQDPQGDGVGCIDVTKTEHKDKMFEISKLLDTNLIKNLDANSTKIEVLAKLLSSSLGNPADEKELIKQK